MQRFIRLHYTDQRLVDVYAHCCDGKLAYASCCCFIGCATSPHPLRPQSMLSLMHTHLEAARELHYAKEAEREYFRLGLSGFRWWMIKLFGRFVSNKTQRRWISNFDDDARRRKLLKPILEAELRYRDRQRAIDNTQWSLVRGKPQIVKSGVKIGMAHGEPVRIYPAPHEFLQ